MDCPRCQALTKTLETRRADGGAAVRRRRRCPSCEHRFTTYERAQPETLDVIKRDGRRQGFDPEKLLASLNGATHKREVNPRRLRGIVDRVEGAIREAGGELPAQRVGELCLEGLELLDRGAYLQFAGTLPDESGNPRKDGGFGPTGSVRSGEDAQRPTPEEGKTRARGAR